MLFYCGDLHQLDVEVRSMMRFEAAAVILRMDAAPGGSFNGSLLKLDWLSSEFNGREAGRGEPGGGRASVYQFSLLTLSAAVLHAYSDGPTQLGVRNGE
jgi:hypothetical protein